jgi:hypothetical protein
MTAGSGVSGARGSARRDRGAIAQSFVVFTRPE